MKKIFCFLILSIFLSLSFAQSNDTVSITNDVYDILSNAAEKGLCEVLSTVKPYSEKYVVEKLNEILENLENKKEQMSEYVYKNQKEIVLSYIEKFQRKEGWDWKKLSYRLEDNVGDVPVSLEFNNGMEGFFSSGVYSDKDLNSTGYEMVYRFDFAGDIGKNFSYKTEGFLGLTAMPLQQVGTDYDIGIWSYEQPGSEYYGVRRTINTFRNNSVLPYSYKKFWDGSVYYLSNMSGSGLEGWPTETSLGFGIYGELRGSFLNDIIEIGMGRVNRDWASMDTGSSLVLNEMAAPFLGFDLKANLFGFLTFSTLTGVLEFPHQEYINANAWNYGRDNIQSGDKLSDAYYFQNAFSIGMVEADFKYLHIDAGSACVWPKRFELGYMFPMMNHVVYQNNVGDYDNLSLFGNIKGKIPSIGSLWFSLYVDELFSLDPSLFFEKTRYMFAYQAGGKADLPFLPFGSISLRYTKVEPYCYTHHAVGNQPWYEGYLAQSYTNNGTCLGYYLPPNSDELFVRIDARPISNLKTGLQYQFVRHGADYGSGQVPGSSIYSEMPTSGRNKLNKYFLRDGAYEWSHIVTLDASYDLKDFGVPLQLICSVGYIYDWFTNIVGTAGKNAKYEKIDTAEYPVKSGFVFTLGFKLFQ